MPRRRPISRERKKDRVKILKQEGHNFLWIDGELWMWDVPQEQKDQRLLAEQAYGDVLVAGYGLGVVQKYLVQNPRVKSVTSVELLEEVVEACKKTYKKLHGRVIIGDFYDHPLDERFDCVIGDVWEDLGPQSLEEYKKFKAKSKELLKPDGKILAWGQDYLEYLLL